MKRYMTFTAVLAAAGMFVIGCEAPQEQDMGGDRAHADSLFDAYVYAWENEDTDTLDAILAPGFTRTVNDGESVDLDSLRGVIGGEGEIKNVNIDLDEIVVAEGLAAGSWTGTGTMGGQSVQFSGASFFSIENGKLASEKVYMDTAPMMMMIQGMSSDTTDTTNSM